MYEKADIQKDRLLIQLQMLPDMIQTYNVTYPETKILRETKILKVTLVRTICDVMNAIPTMLSEIAKLLYILLTIPVSSATAKRSFSTLRRLKTYLRSTMGQQRLNNLMLLHINKDITDTIEELKIAKQIVEVNERTSLVYFRFCWKNRQLHAYGWVNNYNNNDNTLL